MQTPQVLFLLGIKYVVGVDLVVYVFCVLLDPVRTPQAPFCFRIFFFGVNILFFNILWFVKPVRTPQAFFSLGQNKFLG